MLGSRQDAACTDTESGRGFYLRICEEFTPSVSRGLPSAACQELAITRVGAGSQGGEKSLTPEKVIPLCWVRAPDEL